MFVKGNMSDKIRDYKRSKLMNAELVDQLAPGLNAMDRLGFEEPAPQTVEQRSAALEQEGQRLDGLTQNLVVNPNRANYNAPVLTFGEEYLNKTNEDAIGNANARDKYNALLERTKAEQDNPLTRGRTDLANFRLNAAANADATLEEDQTEAGRMTKALDELNLSLGDAIPDFEYVESEAEAIAEQSMKFQNAWEVDAAGKRNSNIFDEAIDADNPSITIRDEMERNFGINPQNRQAVGGAITMMLSRLYAGIANHQLIRQALPDTYDPELRKQRSDNEAVGESIFTDKGKMPNVETVKEDTSLESLKKGREDLEEAFLNPQDQPILRYMLQDINTQMRELLNPDVTSADLGPVDSFFGAAAMLRYFTDEGYITFARDKQGRIIPLNTDSNPLSVIDPGKIGKEKQTEEEKKIEKEETAKQIVEEFRQRGESLSEQELEKETLYRLNQSAMRGYKKVTTLDQLNQSFFPDMRKGNEFTTTKSQLVPVTDHSLLSSVRNVMINPKNGEFKRTEGKGNITKKYLHDAGHRAIKVNSIAYNVLAYMSHNVTKGGFGNGYSTHPLASSLGELDEASYNKYARERGHNQAAGEIGAKHDRIIENMSSKILPRVKDGLSRFMMHYLSPSTNRVFGHSQDTNYYNDKGDVRATLAFGNMKPIPISRNHLDSGYINTLAERVLKSDKKGVNFGLDINQKLQNLSEADMQMLDYYYALGNIMLDLDPNVAAKTEFKRRPTDVIGYVFMDGTVRDKALRLSREINKFFDKPVFDENGEQLRSHRDVPEFNGDGMSVDLKNILSKSGKGEWQYPVTVLAEFQKLDDIKSKLNPREGEAPNINSISHTFNYVFEQDARQSNAAIMSLIMGDRDVASMLGLLPNIYKNKYTNLREKVWANVQEDVATVFTNPNEDGKYRAAFTKFFQGVAKMQDPSKVYARGIVVAGLYGKAARFMYTEANDMFAKVDPSLYKELESAYITGKDSEGGNIINTEQLIRDTASVFNASAKRAMGNLLGYQDYMRSYGRVMGLLNGPTEIEGILPGENLMLGMNNWVPTYEASEMLDQELHDTTKGQYKRATGRMGSILMGGATRITDAGSSAVGVAKREREQKMAETFVGPRDKNFEGVLGTNFRNALPVDMIQAGDSALLMVASEIATGANPDMPLNLFSIHDAAITTAGSTLKMKNAYDNVAMHVVAKQGANAFGNTFTSMQETIKKVEEEVRKLPNRSDGEEVDIGTERIVTQRGAIKNYSGVTSYFDELRARLIKDDFFNDIEIERKGNKAINERMKAKSKRILSIAARNGYIFYDNPIQADQRPRNKVSKKEFLNLLQLIKESEGVIPPDFPDSKLLIPLRGDDGKIVERYGRSAKWVAEDILQVVGYKNLQGKRIFGKGDKLREKLLKQNGWIHNLDS